MTIFEQTEVFSTYSLAWAILPLDEFQPVTQEFSNTIVNYLILKIFFEYKNNNHFKIKIWIRPELIGEFNVNLNQTFEIIEKTFEFIQDYLNISSENFPTKLGNKIF
jgi:hypothetical protein